MKLVFSERTACILHNPHTLIYSFLTKIEHFEYYTKY